MGWIIETVVDLLWDEWIYRTYQRYGWGWAIAAVIAPILVLAALIGLAVALLLET